MENKKIENKQMKNRQTAHKINSLSLRKLTYSALYLALAMVLPFLTGQIPNIGRMLSPLHIPASPSAGHGGLPSALSPRCSVI